MLFRSFTGGDDGSVQKWNVGFKDGPMNGNLDEDTTELYPRTHSHVSDWGHPRLITLIDKETLIGASHSREIRTYTAEGASRLLWTSPAGLKCTAIVFSPSRSLLAVGGSTGLLLVGKGMQQSNLETASVALRKNGVAIRFLSLVR